MKPGDIVTLGQHRLMCGDAFNPEHVDALMGGEKAAMLYCDPPYGITVHDPDKRSRREVRQSDGRYRVVAASAGKDVIGDAEGFDPRQLPHQIRDVPEQFWWGADYYCEHLPEKNAGSWIVWDKRCDAALDKGFGSCFELCWSRRRHKRLIARVPWSGFIGIREEPDKTRHHPTQKPVALAEWFLERFAQPGDSVMDLFGGSGSTLLACERTGRTCRMAEISPEYCEVIIDRYHALTAQPRLVA